MTTNDATTPNDGIDASEVLDTLVITKVQRRTSAGGAWVRGTIAGHRFDALVFPEPATNREWEVALAGAGFDPVQVEGGVTARLSELPEPTEVGEWCARSRTAATDEAEIRRLLSEAMPHERDALGVEERDGKLCFRIWKMVATARTPA